MDNSALQLQHESVRGPLELMGRARTFPAGGEDLGRGPMNLVGTFDANGEGAESAHNAKRHFSLQRDCDLLGFLQLTPRKLSENLRQ